jgi:hypothetical protein
MNKKQIIWIGLGAVALYLYFKNKPNASAVTPNVAPTPLPQMIPIPNAKDLAKKLPKLLPSLIPDKGDNREVTPIPKTPQKIKEEAEYNERVRINKLYENMSCSQLDIAYKKINSLTSQYEKDVLTNEYNSCHTSPYKLDCNWVKENKKKREGSQVNYGGNRGFGYYPYFLQLSKQEREAYKNCGIEIPA